MQTGCWKLLPEYGLQVVKQCFDLHLADLCLQRTIVCS